MRNLSHPITTFSAFKTDIPAGKTFNLFAGRVFIYTPSRLQMRHCARLSVNNLMLCVNTMCSGRKWPARARDGGSVVYCLLLCVCVCVHVCCVCMWSSTTSWYIIYTVYCGHFVKWNIIRSSGRSSERAQI